MIRKFLTAIALTATLACVAELKYYTELADPKPGDDAATWKALGRGLNAAWGSTDIRYGKHSVPKTTSGKLMLSSWRNETVSAQAVIWSSQNLDDVKIKMSGLTDGNSIIPAEDISLGFVRYVMTDELNKDGKSGCGHRPDRSKFDSTLVADVIDPIDRMNIEGMTARPVWVSIRVPADARPGVYRGDLTVSAGGATVELPMELRVSKRTLTAPKDWKMNLDLWQNPYSVARYYGVEPWSEEHFEAMRPLMKMLADAGQRAITTTIMYKPWAGQTCDAFDSMVKRTKLKNGKWRYDYTVFDKWVEFMTDEIGINGLISCYTMIPWDLQFDYYEEGSEERKFVKGAPGEKAYEQYWVPFLKDFARHLKKKGWFERTAIAMDERPMEAMRQAIAVIKKADKNYKVSLAGNYHPEIQQDLYYLCIPYGDKFPADVLAERRKRGQISTYYTCCVDPYPNTFTFSEPAEAAWTPIHAIKGDYDGYLRWAVNSWTEDPLRDSRFIRFAAGDCYSIYPGPRTSIRFERFKEGMQTAEKVRLLREEFEKSGNTDAIKAIEKALVPFSHEALEKPKGKGCAEPVRDLNELVNSL